MWRAYTQLLVRYPLRTKAVTSLGILGSGDILAQFLHFKAFGHVGKKPPKPTEGVVPKDFFSQWNRKRTADLALFGLLVGPMLHYWFGFIEWLLPGPMTSLALASKKMVVDQIFMAPFGSWLFFECVGLLKGHSQERINRKLSHSFYTTMKANYAIWPLLTVINFRFVPLHSRVLFDNSMSVLWSAFLSWMQHYHSKEQSLD